MNAFAKALNNESTHTLTENGADALNTTGSALLDLFGTIGALRNTNQNRVERLFAEAYKENKLLATKCIFYARDIRGGLGERKTFRILLKYAANHHPECIRPNIDLIGKFGRYDDLYSLIDTPLEDAMWVSMKKQFVEDLNNMGEGKPVSLLAKWVKTPDASSKETRKLGIKTALKFNMEVKMFKRLLRGLRKYIDVTEIHMSNGTWSDIDYDKVASRAMFLHRNAFTKHDHERFGCYIGQVQNGETKIHSGTLYPYDILEKYIKGRYEFDDIKEDPVLEAQWKNLPNFVEDEASAIVIADTSGSMEGRPMASAVGLAIYFAERNQGPFNGLWMNFSSESKVCKLKGETLAQKLSNIDASDWGFNTDLKKAFEQILRIAIDNHVPAEEMVKALIIISDMEIDRAVKDTDAADGQKFTLFHDMMSTKFAENGYVLPNIVYWNVDSRHDTFHADKDRVGVQLVSGQSPSTFKNLMHSLNMTPEQMMLEVLNGVRYNCITVE